MKTDVAYIVSHGFAARMVMQTNLLGRLVDKGLKLALIAPDSEDENLKKYCSEKNIRLFEFKAKSSFWSSNYAKARMFFLENIDKNPALLEKYIYALNFDKNATFKSRLRIRLFKVAHGLKEVFPFIKSMFKKRESRMLESMEADRLIDELNPALLVSTYPVNYTEAMLVKSAQKKGSKTVMHLLSWDNISCKGHFPVLADEYIAWGPIMKDELKEYYGIDDSRVYMTGVPHFDLHSESAKDAKEGKYLSPLGLRADKPYVLFGMSSPRFAPKEIDIVEHLAEQISTGVYGQDVQMVIRPHPQNIQGNMTDESWLPRLEQLQNERIALDLPNLAASKMPWSMEHNDMYKLSNLLAGASLSINSGSTLSIDAMMCGTPVILSSFDGASMLPYWKSSRRLIDYTHLKKLTMLEGVSVVDSYDRLKEEMQKYLQDNTYKQNERANTLNQMCFSQDGKATQRVVDTLLTLRSSIN